MTRLSAALGFVVTVALGLASRRWPIGVHLWDKSAGDVLYAIMISFVVAFFRPRAKPAAIGGIAIAVCVAIELFQLTGIPAAAPRVLRFALGTAFAWHEIVCYVVGGALAIGLHHCVRAREQRPG